MGCGVIETGAWRVRFRSRRADCGVRVISRVSRQREMTSQTSATSDAGAISQGTAFKTCFGSTRACLRNVPQDATSFSSCLGGRMTWQEMYGLFPMGTCRSFRHVISSSRSAALSSFETVCLPFTARGSKFAESCDATVPESEITEAGDEGLDGGGGSEWINSAAYLRIRGSRESEGWNQCNRSGLQWLQQRSRGGLRLRSRIVQLSSWAELRETAPDFEAMVPVKLVYVSRPVSGRNSLAMKTWEHAILRDQCLAHSDLEVSTYVPRKHRN
jgi:hypothetical protein